MTDLVAEVMSHREFASLLNEVPQVTRGILRGVAARLRAPTPTSCTNQPGWPSTNPHPVRRLRGTENREK